MKSASPYIAILASGLISCASPDAVRPFPPDPTYTERRADPGKVDEVCYTPDGKHDDGRRQTWKDSYCGCVDFINKIVWLARIMACDLELVALHEACHIRTGPSAEARAACRRDFPTR